MQGVHPVTAYRWFREGRLPVPARRVGRLILVDPLPEPAVSGRVVAYARVSSADRWYPSSKTCSACGTVKAKLPLRVRTFVCTACGMSLDRDLNAARNLAQLIDARSGRESQNGRGADRKTPLAGLVATKRLPRTVSAGKTGTVPPQGGTADHELTHAY